MVVLARVAAVAVVAAGGLVCSVEARQCVFPSVSTYCTPGTTVQGCVPSISGVGAPSSQAPSGFDIVVDNVPTQRMGLIFYGLNSIPQPQPWAVGSASYLCIYYPVNRTGAHNSGGLAGPCDGELRVDFNAWRAANPTALGSPFSSGQTIYAQGWFRDPGAAKQTNLSGGLKFVLGPTACLRPSLALVPAGSFSMGSNAASGPPYFGSITTQPVHQVTISYNYWMGRSEVTQGEYVSLMGTNPSHSVNVYNPVNTVTWHQARSYCAALTVQQSALGGVPVGYEYRLPTEAEWEHACRAGTTTEFNVGPALFCGDAAFWYSYHSLATCSGAPISVFSYVPNALDLYEMHGNFAEWCLDSFAPYPSGPTFDPFVTGGPTRVARGGSFDSPSSDCRSASRRALAPTSADGEVGFRVVLAPILVP